MDFEWTKLRRNYKISPNISAYFIAQREIVWTAIQATRFISVDLCRCFVHPCDWQNFTCQWHSFNNICTLHFQQQINNYQQTRNWMLIINRTKKKFINFERQLTSWSHRKPIKHTIVRCLRSIIDQFWNRVWIICNRCESIGISYFYSINQQCENSSELFAVDKVCEKGHWKWTCPFGRVFFSLALCARSLIERDVSLSL